MGIFMFFLSQVRLLAGKAHPELKITLGGSWFPLKVFDLLWRQISYWGEDPDLLELLQNFDSKGFKFWFETALSVIAAFVLTVARWNASFWEHRLQSLPWQLFSYTYVAGNTVNEIIGSFPLRHDKVWFIQQFELILS